MYSRNSATFKPIHPSSNTEEGGRTYVTILVQLCELIASKGLICCHLCSQQIYFSAHYKFEKTIYWKYIKS